jgi:NADPH-dependent glutamate synthase beta subunit-like oxidoreductase/NAD-dependent dihydropyrimidine dehydrogenase PreA subunit
MIPLVLDGRSVEVPPGASLLDAARRLGVDIPTLCYLERCGPMNSCLVCVVKVTLNGSSRVVPACGTRAVAGMVVDSETAEVRALRRTALELLLSDHVGDCLSPCHRICPLDLNIPRMIRQIQVGQLREAMATVRQGLALPSTLGRLCHAPCQNGCRRSGCDDSAAIRDLERHVADSDAATAAPVVPPRRPLSGRRVAIVGAGPAGLAAAYHLLREGHACTVIDRGDRPGGTLRTLPDAVAFGPEVLANDLRVFAALGAEFRLGTEVGKTVGMDELRRDFDAVLLATGELAPGDREWFGLPRQGTPLAEPAIVSQEGLGAVFCAGSVAKSVRQLVRAMAEGQAVAEQVHQHLSGQKVTPRAKPFSSVMGRLEPLELERFRIGIADGPRTPPSRGLQLGFTANEAKQEAGRCLHCDCRAAGSCDLQRYAELYGANPNRFPRQRRPFEQQVHPARVLFEPGKCILCGICVHIAQEAAEPLGLTFIGRGFDVRVSAPFDEAFAAGLTRVAADCVAHCPTGAIEFDDRPGGAPQPG